MKKPLETLQPDAIVARLNELDVEKVSNTSSDNIAQMSDKELDELRVGDVVRKKTGNQYHCYFVTYKEEKHGICLSYFACGYTETVSYDYVEGHWVYNSKDVMELVGQPLYEDVDIATGIDIVVSDHSEITFEKGFCSIRKTKENELYIVINFAMTNTGESSVSVSNLLYMDITLPQEIAEKIYDINGKTVADTTSAYGITGCQYYTDNGNVNVGFYTTNPCSIVNRTLANKMSAQLRGYGSIAAGATHHVTLRVFLTL